MVLRARIQEDLTGNVFVDALVSGYEFYDTAVPAGSPITITYRLAGSIAWTTDNAEVAFENALAAWADVARVQFVQLTSGTATWTETLYSNAGSSTLGSHYFPNTQSLGGEFNVGHSLSTTGNNARGGISYVTFLHELGHGLGLNHSFEPDAFPGVDGGDPYDRGDNNFNNGLYTVMAYDDDPWLAVSPSYAFGYAATPMAFDVAAIQSIYGANLGTRTGDDFYVLPSANASGTYWSCIWDAGGTDTIRAAAGAAAACEIDLRAATLLNAEGGGGWISRQGGIYGGFTIANQVVIENAIGGNGGDTLRGNDAANRIDGLAGNDVIYGYDGGDILTGGAGSDQLYGGGGADLFTYTLASDSSTAGRDILFDFVSGEDRIDLGALTVSSYAITGTGGRYFLDAVIGTVTLSIDIRSANGFVASDVIGLATPDVVLKGTAAAETLTGGAGNDRLRGLGGDDLLIGLGGNDSIDGGTGVDRMEGGAGDDGYFVDDPADLVVELAGQGLDTVYSSAPTYLLPADVERLILRDNALDGTGNDLDNLIQGTAAGNRLLGGGGVDSLTGREGDDHLDGGSGADVMDGGAGNDFFVVDDRKDRAVEAAGAGHDTVLSSASTFRLRDNVEDLVLTGPAVGGYGNDLANRLTGTATNNYLSGEEGDDVIDGGDGRDELWGGAGFDVVTGGGGNDLIRFKPGHFAGLTADTADRITDFDAAEGDLLDLRLIDAVAGGADDKFRYIGDSAFGGTAGELRIDVAAGHLLLLGDTDGNGVADLAIRLDGLATLEAAAILL